MKGYLLDTNHVGAWERKDPKFLAELAKEPDNLPRVSTITIGELEFGNRITITTDQARRDEYKAFIVANLAPFALPLTIHTAVYYAKILERIWKAHPPGPKTRTESHLVNLGVDVNDVWICALAWEHGLILLSADAMTLIRKHAPELQVVSWI